MANPLDDCIVLDSESRIDCEPGRGATAPGDADPDHHLWRNGRLWWIAFTVHRGHLQERVRFSLGTPDVVEARRRRDHALALFAKAPELRISLRFARPRVGEAAAGRNS